jgi:hypothetical protein
MASVIKCKTRPDIEKEVFTEASSACLRKIHVRVVMTVRKVTIETIRVAVKMKRLRVVEVNNMNLFSKSMYSPVFLTAGTRPC